MNRTEVIVGSAIAALAVAGFGQIYFDKGALRDAPPPKPEPVAESAPQAPEGQAQTELGPIGVDELVAGFMTSLEQGTRDQKVESLTSLLDQLDSPAYAKAALDPDTAEPLAKAAVAAVTVSTEAETPELAALRGRLAYALAARIHGKTSKEFVLDQLANGTPEIKAQLARGLAQPGAAGRLGAAKAAAPLVAVMQGASDWKTIGACVVALQDSGRDPSVLGPSLERLEQLGLLEKSDKLPWISPRLFSAFMAKADGRDLQRGLRVAGARTSLLKASLDAAKRGLDSSEAETRRVAAQAVRQAVIQNLVSPQEGESLLAGRLGHETEPVLKAELTGGLEQVRGLMPKAPQAVQ